MIDRPNPDAAPEQPQADPQPEPAGAEPVAEPQLNAEAVAEPARLDQAAPVAEPVSPDQVAPAPEPATPDQTGPIEVEPHTLVEAVAEGGAPAQVAPQPGSAPIPLEPEPSVPEPPAVPPVALEPSTDQTLALPPTTKEVEPPPVPSAPPPPPTGVPVPFAAPPTGHSTYFGLKLGLGIGGSFLAVASVVIAVVAAFVTFSTSLTEKVETTAEDFIGELADEDWDTAYAMLCDELRHRPADDYVAEWESWHADSAEVQPMGVEDTEVIVALADGSAIALTIKVDQSAETLDTSVCNWRTTTGQ